MQSNSPFSLSYFSFLIENGNVKMENVSAMLGISFRFSRIRYFLVSLFHPPASPGAKTTLCSRWVNGIAQQKFYHSSCSLQPPE